MKLFVQNSIEGEEAQDNGLVWPSRCVPIGGRREPAGVIQYMDDLHPHTPYYMPSDDTKEPVFLMDTR